MLRSLASKRALVLHPDRDEVWIAHPFSSSPSAFWVESDGRGWWGNCAWCSLGIAALCGGEVRIYTRCGGERSPLELLVSDGRVSGAECVHMPLPVARLWDNVVHSCSMMLCFSRASLVEDWCRRHGLPRGQILSLDKAWELAQGWYGGYLEPAWNRKSPDEVRSFYQGSGWEWTLDLVETVLLCLALTLPVWAWKPVTYESLAEVVLRDFLEGRGLSRRSGTAFSASFEGKVLD
ncbi:MAG: alkylmercury lyase family protein [Candidatus Eremiobacteraeota bacterium]|nr:alkylmercury lyase family protein [Candidatus Eremiobacteraeota bacterium]MCW5868563.1 alkylmercury lyase family protein [Candidatus Eremiobacteraeota bacterium]